MPTILHYLDIPGRGEPTRVALAVAGVDHEDRRLSFKEFATSRFKLLPVLEINGTEYTQSTAMLRYAGKLGGLYPEDPLTAMKVDEIVMASEDFNITMFSTVAIQDPTQKLEARKELSTGKLKTMLEGLAAKLAANPSSPYFVGESLTIADLQVHSIILNLELGFLEGFPPTLVSDVAPTIKAHHDAVMQHPKVKAYYACKA